MNLPPLPISPSMDPDAYRVALACITVPDDSLTGPLRIIGDTFDEKFDDTQDMVTFTQHVIGALVAYNRYLINVISAERGVDPMELLAAFGRQQEQVFAKEQEHDRD